MTRCTCIRHRIFTVLIPDPACPARHLHQQATRPQGGTP